MASDPTAEQPVPVAQTAPAGFTRRGMGQWLAGGLVALAAGAEYVAYQRHRAMVNALLLRARRARQAGSAYALRQASRIIQQAIRLDGGRADLWGLAAVIYRQQARLLPPTKREAMEQQADGAIEQALELDTSQSDAMTADAARKWAMFEFAHYEGALRAILARAPDTVPALEDLGAFLQGVGRWEEASAFNHRLLAAEPYSAVGNRRLAMIAWSAGLVGEANATIASYLARAPDNPLLLHARLRLFAFTGRSLAARAMLQRPQVARLLPKPALDAWRSALTALSDQGNSAAAAAELRQLAANGREMAGDAALLLCALGQLDDAFAVARDDLAASAQLLPDGSRPTAPPAMYADPAWRRTWWLFAPPAAPLRTDSRFTALCQQAGFMRYWQGTGHWPDPPLRGSLEVSAPPARSG